ncbi:MAG: PE family protein [Mycobacterium sp.]
MSFVFMAPEMVTSAAQNLANLHSTLTEAAAAAAAPTTAVVAAAEDEVSAAVVAIFGAVGQEYQAISAQAAAFHAQFVNMLNGSAAAYLCTEVSNAEHALSNAVGMPAAAPTTPVGGAVGDVVGPYENLAANTAANLQSLENTWMTVTGPALAQAFNSQIQTPGLIATALASGNLQSVLNVAGRSGLGYANLVQQLTVPVSLSLTSATPTGASFALGVALPQLLAFDALGAPINAASAAAASSAAFYGAMQAGNPLAAAIALIDAPANIANGFLNGEQNFSLSLPLPGLSVTANVPVTGLLVPLQPFTATSSVPGSPLLNTVTVTGPPTGGLIPALANYVPELIATAFTI